MNDNSNKKHENNMLESEYINIEKIENNYMNIDRNKCISITENNNIIEDKVWTEKDTIEAETQQMADLLGFNSEMRIQENKQENKQENIEAKTKGEIPKILYQRKKYKGKKKKK